MLIIGTISSAVLGFPNINKIFTKEIINIIIENSSQIIIFLVSIIKILLVISSIAWLIQLIRDMEITYKHTNIIARDWKTLAVFYEKVFGCVRVPPERNLSGEWLEKGTGVPGARLTGVHLRLPGHGEDGPTLEMFQYSEMLPN